jgi:hypothetical protein
LHKHAKTNAKANKETQRHAETQGQNNKTATHSAAAKQTLFVVGRVSEQGLDILALDCGV